MLVQPVLQQVCPLPHATPQPPQLDASRTQRPPQQLWPEAHATPQVPQLEVVSRSTQLLPQQPGTANPRVGSLQSVCDAPQQPSSVAVSAHRPLQQTSLPLHAVPHVPQLLRSLSRSVHVGGTSQHPGVTTPGTA